MTLSKPATITAIVLGIVLFIVVWFISNFNGLVSQKAGVDNSWAKVETQYQRRLDLIDNIVASVKGSQGQEQAVFGRIADARKQYDSASSTEDKAAAASSIESNIAILPRLQEAYPDLKSNDQVTRLINELSSTENSIVGVRDNYNDTVTKYNVTITRFPNSIFSSMYGFDRAKLFRSDVTASKAPQVNFSTESATQK